MPAVPTRAPRPSSNSGQTLAQTARRQRFPSRAPPRPKPAPRVNHPARDESDESGEALAAMLEKENDDLQAIVRELNFALGELEKRTGPFPLTLCIVGMTILSASYNESSWIPYF